MIHGHDEIRDAYRDVGVASTYVDQRFREPLGALLHKHQVKFLRDFFAREQPGRVLEIAPGPARLTLDVSSAVGAFLVLMDTSAQMLAEARARLRHIRQAPIVQGDAFGLPFQGGFDTIYTFRLIRHFGDDDRLRLYQQCARVLRPGGCLIFDALNELVATETKRRDPGAARHFDAVLSPEKIEKELRESGFLLVSLVPVQRRFHSLYTIQILVAPRSRRLAHLMMSFLDRIPGGEPMEWIVVAKRA